MIVVTTPTGKIGSQVLQQLHDVDEPLRVIVRDASRLPEAVRASVEIVEGSHGEEDVVMRAFEGARAVFWLVAADPKAPSVEDAFVGFSRSACSAIVAQGVRQVVGVSALGRGWPGPTGNVGASLAMDDLIAGTGVAYRALACASLMENVLRQAASIRETGDFYWPMPSNMRTRHVACRDVAAIAARWLRDPFWTGAEATPLLGPEDLTFEEMMAMVSDAVERPVRYHELALADLRETMIARGASVGMAQAMVQMMAAKSQGLDDQPKRTRAIAASTPTTFRQWCNLMLASGAHP